MDVKVDELGQRGLQDDDTPRRRARRPASAGGPECFQHSAAGRKKASTGHLATLIQASRTTVVRWIEEGRVRARRTVGGWYVISREEVINFLWDLSFSKETPLRIWRAATLAYEEMTKPKDAKKAGKAKKPRKKK